jgi:hypothetical protein
MEDFIITGAAIAAAPVVLMNLRREKDELGFIVYMY